MTSPVSNSFIRPLSIMKILFGKLLEGIRGPRTLEEIDNNGTLQTTLTGITLRGFVINITCTQHEKYCRYSRWWVKDKLLCTYEVSATYEGEPPAHLIPIVNEVSHFPNILVSWVSHADQREAAIKAYLDIIISKLPSRGQKKIPITV